MRIIADIRCLLDAQRSGVGVYAARTVGGLLDAYPGAVRAWYAAARERTLADMPPNAVDHAACPGKLWAALASAGLTGVGAAGDTVFMPNIHFMRVPADARLVVTAHDLSYERYPEFFTAKQRAWHAAVRPRALYRRADAIIAVSRHTKQDLVDLYGIAPEKIFVIYPGVSRPAAARQPARSRYLLYVGAFEPRKNVISIIEAFEQIAGAVPDVTLALAGAGGWNNAHLYRAAARSRVSSRIRLLGYVSDAELQSLYAGAAVFVYPSFYEGFGFPPLEAQAYGVPVIAGANSAQAEVLGDTALLVQPDFVDMLAQAMHAILTDAPLAQRLSVSGEKNARRFDWESSVRATAQLLTADA